MLGSREDWSHGAHLLLDLVGWMYVPVCSSSSSSSSSCGCCCGLKWEPVKHNQESESMAIVPLESIFLFFWLGFQILHRVCREWLLAYIFQQSHLGDSIRSFGPIVNGIYGMSCPWKSIPFTLASWRLLLWIKTSHRWACYRNFIL